MAKPPIVKAGEDDGGAATVRPKHFKPRAQGPRSQKPRVYYTPALGERICDRIASGERWHSMAGSDDLPAHAALYKWATQYPKFGEQLALAQRSGANARADKVLNLAETATKETVVVDRLHIGALKWHVERDDKQFGPRKDERDTARTHRVIIEVRQFERAVREDGTPFVREILPNGDVVDL